MQKEEKAEIAQSFGMRRRITGFFGTIALVATFLVAPFVSLVATPQAAEAADLSGFDPGFIISDELFYDGNAMTAAQVQTFLNNMVKDCAAEHGYPCLKNATDVTIAKAASPNVNGPGTRCAAISGGRTLTAAQIIAEVGQACGISQKALLVILQKERGLVTKVSPTVSDYRISMGYGCPDTAPCNTEYYGFFNQVFLAAQQYKIYKDRATSYGYQAGRNNFIYWHPNASCGGSNVFIRNQATAGLYIYTPYQPNAASLAAGYGTGNSCSSYGNRNFYHYYNDWFGSSTVANSLVRGWFATKWFDLGGKDGVIGDVVAQNSYLTGAWQIQQFQHGSMVFDNGALQGFWMPTAIFDHWVANGGPTGTFGKALADPDKTETGWRQAFLNHTIRWDETNGIQVETGFSVAGSFLTNYQALGGAAGVLGNVVAAQSGTVEWPRQQFQHGWLLHDKNNQVMYLIRGAIAKPYFDAGGPTGGFGPPVDNAQGSDTEGWTQEFRFGTITEKPDKTVTTRGGYPIEGSYLTNWLKLQSMPAREMGFPLGKQKNLGNGWGNQEFEKGWLLHDSSKNIMYTLLPEIAEFYFSKGGPTGVYGSPVDNATVTADSIVQEFTNGRITWTRGVGVSALGGLSLTGVFKTNWTALNNRPGQALGYALRAPENLGHGWQAQEFKNAWLLHDGTRNITYLVRPAIAQHYFANGGPTGPLGGPRDNATSGSGVYTQVFAQGWIKEAADGTITSAGTFPVSGAFKSNWTALSTRPGLALGFSIGAQTSIDQRWSQQRFENGWLLYDGSAKIMYLINNQIGQYYFANGGPTGAMGGPRDNATGSSSTGWRQDFQNRSIIWSPSTGATDVDRIPDVVGLFATNWTALQSRPAMQLGYATGSQIALDSRWSYQAFQSGYLLYDASGRVMYHLHKNIGDHYFANNGPLGKFGGPLDNATGSAQTSLTQYFSKGMITDTAGTITEASGEQITGLFASNHSALRISYGLNLGYASTQAITLDSRWQVQHFQSGSLLYDGTSRVMYLIHKPIADYYFANGGPTGALGGPKANASGTPSSSLRQEFVGGVLEWNTNDGVVVK